MKNKKVFALLLAWIMGIAMCLPQQSLVTAGEILTEDGVETKDETISKDEGEIVEPDTDKETGTDNEQEGEINESAVYTYNNHYYGVYIVNGYTWQLAKAYCEDAGGYLAVITDAEEQAFIERINQQTNLWIGGYRDDEFNWYWVNGEKWDYTNWMEGEPNDSSNVVANENCLTVWPTQWNDINEDNIYEQYGFICEWNSVDDMVGVVPPEDIEPTEEPVITEIPKETEEPIKTEVPKKTEEPITTATPEKPEPTEVTAKGTVFSYNGHFYSCYEVTGYTWQNAKEYCDEAGGYLAVITDEGEQAFIERINQQTNLWIGGYRDDEFNWYWVNGETWDYTNWMEGEPNDSSNVVSNENCLTVWPTQWNDINEENIYEQYGFICEWDSEAFMTGIAAPENIEDKPDDGEIETKPEPGPSDLPMPSKIPVDRKEEITENEDGSITKVVTETQVLEDGSSQVKEIVENTYVTESGEVVSTKQVTDEKKSVSGVSLEIYEYDASVLPENATWNTTEVEELEEETQSKLEEAGITESSVYDISPEVDGEIVQPENGKVKISLNCGSKWQNKNVAVYDLEKGQYLEAKAEGEMVVFEAEHFSMYAVVEVAESDEQYIKGDVTGDGLVDLDDANMILKAALGIVTFEISQIRSADVASNGSVDLDDANMVLKAALGIIIL